MPLVLVLRLEPVASRGVTMIKLNYAEKIQRNLLENQMSDMIEVVIDSIRVGLMSQQRVVLLREVDSDRYLAIWIDAYMAEQITFALQDVEVSRPMSHDLMKNIVHNLDARIIRVEVIELKEEVFYGSIVVETSSGFVINIDSRPSDALSLAVRVNVPIMVSPQVMEDAGIIPEDDLVEDNGIIAKGLESSQDEVPVSSPENGEENLSIYEDFLDNLGTDSPGDKDPKKDDDK